VRLIDSVAEHKKVVMLAQISQSSGLQGVLIMDIMIDTINKKFLRR